MNNLQKILKTAAGTFAAIPGITIMVTSLGVPPGQSKVLFGGFIQCLSALALIIIYANQNRILKLEIKKLTKLTVSLGVCFILFFCLYLFSYDWSVVNHPDYSPTFFPLWTSGELKSLLNEVDKVELISKYGREGVIQLIEEYSSLSLNLSAILFLLCYVLVFLSLVSSFAFAGIKYEQVKKSGS